MWLLKKIFQPNLLRGTAQQVHNYLSKIVTILDSCAICSMAKCLKVLRKIILEISFKAWQSVKRLWKCTQIDKSILIFSANKSIFIQTVLHYHLLVLMANCFSLNFATFFKGKTFIAELSWFCSDQREALSLIFNLEISGTVKRHHLLKIQ